MKTLKEYINESLQSRVFVVVKPGFLDLSQDIISRFKEDGWEMERTIIKQLLPQESRRLYSVHKHEDFYKDLCKYMASGPCRAIIFVNIKENPHDPFASVKVIKDEIRDKYKESDMRNVLHSSDSIDAMAKESSIFFA